MFGLRSSFELLKYSRMNSVRLRKNAILTANGSLSSPKFGCQTRLILSLDCYASLCNWNGRPGYLRGCSDGTDSRDFKNQAPSYSRKLAL